MNRLEENSTAVGSGGDFAVSPLPQIVVGLTRGGIVVGCESKLAGGCARFEFAPGGSVHSALHPDCNRPECALLALLESGLRRIDEARILEWELPPAVVGINVRLQLQRTPNLGEIWAILAILDITEGRRRTTTLLDANLSLSSLVQRSKLERTREIGRLDRKLRDLSGQLILEQEKERRRIASDLHDSVNQWLSLSKLYLEAALARMDGGTGSREVTRAFECLRTSIKEVRAVVSNLRPSMLEEFGLVATMELLCQELQASAPSMRVAFDADDGRARISLPQCIAMVRILQEALQNIAKHSNATQVDVKVRLQSDSATLSVMDNGRGFDTNSVDKSRVGLSSMRERALRSGGRMRLTSSTGNGVEIAVRWQLNGQVDEQVESGTYKTIRYGVSNDGGGVM